MRSFLLIKLVLCGADGWERTINEAKRAWPTIPFGEASDVPHMLLLEEIVRVVYIGYAGEVPKGIVTTR